MRTDDFAGGLFGPSDGYIDGHLYCTLLADWIAERGGASSAAPRSQGDERDNGRHRLQTSTGVLECDHVVNAAGGWAGESASCWARRSRCCPQRHQALHVRLPRELEYRMPSVMDYIPSSGEPRPVLPRRGPRAADRGAAHRGVDTTSSTPDEASRSQALEFTEQVARALRRAPARTGRRATRRRLGRHLPDEPGRTARRRPRSRATRASSPSPARAAQGSRAPRRSARSPPTGSCTASRARSPAPPSWRLADMRSDELYAAAVGALPGGNTRTTLFVPPHPPYARRGEGCWIDDEDGHRGHRPAEQLHGADPRPRAPGGDRGGDRGAARRERVRPADARTRSRSPPSCRRACPRASAGASPTPAPRR